jgi:hypothetical protein
LSARNWMARSARILEAGGGVRLCSAAREGDALALSSCCTATLLQLIKIDIQLAEEIVG